MPNKRHYLYCTPKNVQFLLYQMYLIDHYFPKVQKYIIIYNRIFQANATNFIPLMQSFFYHYVYIINFYKDIFTAIIKPQIKLNIGGY